jgi:hypothetical protein
MRRLPPDGQSIFSGFLKNEFVESRWFRRGWTLQELVAPSCMVFFDKNWLEMGTKSSLCDQISAITNIDKKFLLGQPIHTASIATRVSWASHRETKRTEDFAYWSAQAVSASLVMAG